MRAIFFAVGSALVSSLLLRELTLAVWRIVTGVATPVQRQSA